MFAKDEFQVRGNVHTQRISNYLHLKAKIQRHNQRFSFPGISYVKTGDV